MVTSASQASINPVDVLTPTLPKNNKDKWDGAFEAMLSDKSGDQEAIAQDGSQVVTEEITEEEVVEEIVEEVVEEIVEGEVEEESEESKGEQKNGQTAKKDGAKEGSGDKLAAADAQVGAGKNGAKPSQVKEDIEHKIMEVKDASKSIVAKTDKAVDDIKRAADEKNLGLQSIKVDSGPAKKLLSSGKDKLQQNIQHFKSEIQSKAQASAVAINDKKPGTEVVENEEEKIKKQKLLAELLSKHDPQKNAQREQENKEAKIKYKVVKGDKAMVIQRSSQLPKEITDSKIRNEELQTEFEREVKEILGGGTKGTYELTKESIKLTKTTSTEKLDPIKDVKTNLTEVVENAKHKATLQMRDMDSESNTDGDSNKQWNDDKQQTSPDRKEVDSSEKTSQGTQIHTKQEVNYKNAIARETIRNFASALREEIQNYKPPITRINLELNPNNLGEVTLNIIKKGKDLMVNITSNASVMNMFAQNAQELRTNLMDIGFSNLDLSFHSNEGGEGDRQESGRSSTENGLQEIEESALNGIIPESIDVLIPDYA